MSARRLAVVLKPAARRDVRSILLYTLDQWGSEQRDTYRESLDRALATLSVNPGIGRIRDEVGPGIRSYAIQQHVVYYRASGDTVTVLRILHQKMDAVPQFQTP